MKRRQQPIVFVEWADSSGPSDSSVWSDIEEFDKLKHQTFSCFTVGYLMFETKDRIGVAAHLALCDDPTHDILQVSGVMTIPKRAIIERRVLVARSISPV